MPFVWMPIQKDAYFVAAQLAEVAKDFDIIMAGIEASDYNGSAVGGMLAEFLNIASVSSVSKMEIEGGNVTVTREIDGGSESVAVQTPFVAIVQKRDYQRTPNSCHAWNYDGS